MSSTQPLWDLYIRDADGAARPLPDPAPDYIVVAVDGNTVTCPRVHGGGPNRNHLRADEGLEQLLDLFIPRDGKPHSVTLRWRILGMQGLVAQRTLPVPLKHGEDDEAGATDAAAGGDGVAARGIDFAESMAQHLVIAADGRARDALTMAQAFVGATQAQTAALIQATQAQAAAIIQASQAQSAAVIQASQAQVAQAEERTRAALAAVSQSATAALDRVGEGGGGGVDGPWGAVAQLAPMVVPPVLLGLQHLWEKMGGFDGIRSMLGGGAAGEHKGEVILGAVDRVVSGLENMAATRVAAAMPTPVDEEDAAIVVDVVEAEAAA